MSEQLTIYVDEEVADVVESLQESSRERSDLWDMSRSEAARELLEHGIETAGDNPDLEELLDDLDVEIYQKQKRQDRLQKQGRIDDMRGGWRGRVRSRLNGRLAGPEPYDPEIISDLLELYWDEIETWEDDPERIEDHRQWLDSIEQQYLDAFEAKQVLPDDGFERIDDVEVGADLLSLRGRFGEMIETIGARAESEAFDPDAIIRSIAQEHAVDEEAIEIVLDALLPDDVSHRQALKDLETAGIDEILPDQVIDDYGADVEEIAREEGERIEGAATPMIRAPDAEETDPTIDVDEADRVVDQELVGDGGSTDD